MDFRQTSERVNAICRRSFLAGASGLLMTTACRTKGNAARPDLYACEGCDAVLERRADTLGWEMDVARGEPGEPLVLEGRVYQVDGRTPAQGVVIYMHQTNARGLYANGSPETENSRRHGRLRGWARTDAAGRFRFVTIKPAPYPDMTMPAHIHLTVLEPERPPYYVDDVVFDGEFKVDQSYRARQELRGGSGIVRLSRDSQGRWRARRNIILERHPD